MADEEKKAAGEEKKEESGKRGKIDDIAQLYYSRKDVGLYLVRFSKNREVVARFYEGFGKRPDTLAYESDIIEQVRNGATSFHSSLELWGDPLEISTEMSKQQLDDLRIGWDLLIDIDSKYLDYSKTAAKLIIQALEFHSIKSIGVKFSGSKGFHIIIPSKAFPKEMNNVETRKMFPDWARIICQYLIEFIKERLIEKISDLMHGERKAYVKDFEASKEVAPDIVLVSSRHLFRMPYSLHEKTALASIVIDKDKISDFQINDANPLKVRIKEFIPDCEEGEARELLIQALDWAKRSEKSDRRESKDGKNYEEVVIKDLSPSMYPPCITKILGGMKQDGRKRALFILMNFFKSLNMSDSEIKEKVFGWNKKNYHQLKDGYITSQLSWQARQKKMLPPNCDKYYPELQLCEKDNLCMKVKNPVNYVVKKSFLLRKQKAGKIDWKGKEKEERK